MRHLTMAVMLVVLWAGSVQAQTSPHGNISAPCDACHSAESWTTMRSPLRFDHARTGFPLGGQHRVVRCTACHASLRFTGAKTRCADCHDDLHRGELGQLCDRCHSPVTWLVPDMVRKHSGTRFALVGAHAAAPCESCHPNQQKHQYVGIRTECYACHSSDYQTSRSPNHRTAGFGTDCTQCHSVTSASWGTGFDHSRTGFPLVGAHAATPCIQCHTGGSFGKAATQCVACHSKDFAAAASPKHTGFSTDCISCHSVSGWRPASFNHATTAFSLTGAHRATACTDCHKNGVFTGTPKLCATCHQQNFANAVNPKHTGFSTDCATCHTTTAWRPASYNHSTSAFPLTGAHQAVACIDCHKNGVFTGTPKLCATCHQQNFANAVNPKHTGFSTDCASCHTTTAWRPASFNHSTSAFPLTGAHQAVACIDCHKNSVFTGTPTLCYACHQQNYASVTTPRHSPGISTTCTTCHTTTAWKPSTFNHGTAAFALTGFHVSVPCGSCHLNGIYAGTPKSCGDVACHRSRYDATTNPNHAAALFPTDCSTCHSTTAWVPSTWNHTPYFPISSGRHGPGTWSTCADCHRVPTNYKSFSCIDCHAHSSQSQVDSHHTRVVNYSYTSAGCYSCHPKGTTG